MSVQIKNIFFDFDGVLAESVSAKTEAFKEMYMPYGVEIANKVVDYHLQNGGISRFEKFKFWEQTFFNRTLIEEEIQQLAIQFSNIVLHKVIKASEVKGARTFLEKHINDVNYWIITGTPTQEMLIIAKKRRIDKFFKGIFGSPQKKHYWTEHIVNTFNLKRSETLFLGDAMADYEAAMYSNLHFALRATDDNYSLFKNYKGLKFRDFIELEEVLGPLLKKN